MLQIALNLPLPNKKLRINYGLVSSELFYFKSSLILVVEIPGVRGK